MMVDRSCSSSIATVDFRSTAAEEFISAACLARSGNKSPSRHIPPILTCIALLHLRTTLHNALIQGLWYCIDDTIVVGG
ncbi:hypothetical protein EON63_18510 [archaeon]|nr:MAG: hypothetical protein EON63_18510 [archaeon]